MAATELIIGWFGGTLSALVIAYVQQRWSNQAHQKDLLWTKEQERRRAVVVALVQLLKETEVSGEHVAARIANSIVEAQAFMDFKDKKDTELNRAAMELAMRCETNPHDMLGIMAAHDKLITALQKYNRSGYR